MIILGEAVFIFTYIYQKTVGEIIEEATNKHTLIIVRG